MLQAHDNPVTQEHIPKAPQDDTLPIEATTSATAEATTTTTVPSTAHPEPLPSPTLHHTTITTALHTQPEGLTISQETESNSTTISAVATTSTTSSSPDTTTPPPEVLCAQCDRPMQGSFVRALGATYHLECFKCLDCSQVAANKFFPITENGKQYPLCERDYFRRLNLLCYSCGEALRGSYITALENKYHLDHFTCSICPTVFGPQDSYYEHESKVYCHYHYSVHYAVKCAGCRTAILKQFVEINRNGLDEHWHPECYMINKFWNVKLSFAPKGEDESPQPALEVGSEQPEQPLLLSTAEEEATTATLESTTTEEATSTTTDVAATTLALESRTPEELKRAQHQMEEKVYQIWTVLSAFEESSAGCISEMLLHVSNGSYYDGVQMAEKFILHVEILFSAIDDLELQMREAGDMNEMAHGKDAKMLCKKIVNFFSLLSHTQETGVRRLGMTQELLSLVTGLAHYLKVLIRVALTCALTLEREYHSTTVIARFLNKLMELANRDKCLRDLHGKGTMDADVTSDLCLSCRTTIENECFTFDHLHRWHPKCLICSGCAKPLADVYYDANFDAGNTSVLCQECKMPTYTTGFLHVTKLEQYTFLLRVALVRLESLLDLKDAEAGETEDRGRHLTTPPSSGPLSPSNLIRKDSRSKSSSSEDYRPYENINLGDIKRVRSTNIDNNAGRFSRRQTVVAHHTGSSGTSDQQDVRLNGGEVSGVQVQIEELAENGALPSEVRQTVDLAELTERLQINTTAANLSPSSSLRIRSNRSSRQGSQHFPSTKYPKRQYLNELSALELFMVKHLAVVILEPIVSEFFTPEDLLDLVGPRKQTLWGRFVKGLKTDKRKTKVEGTFGVPLEVLVERSGIDSAWGAGPGRIRIPSFIDESITAMRGMDMSIEGIFRKNGNIRGLKELSEAIDKDASSVDLTEENAVQIAALLKKFLRELPDPLLTFKLHRLFVVSQKIKDEEVRKLILHLTCCLLPQCNRDSMEAICLFLRWVASFSHVNDETGSKMDLRNLATVITPNILYSKSKDPIKDESFLAIEAVMRLLQYQDDFCVVPPDLAAVLKDQDLVESSTDLSSKDILKRCENLIKSKATKAHPTTEGHKHPPTPQQPPTGTSTAAAFKTVGIKPEATTVTNGADQSGQSNPIAIQRPNILGREQSVHVLVQTAHHHIPRPQTPISPQQSPPSSALAPIGITERPQVVAVGGGKDVLSLSI
ncbi:hypothetical protein BG006_005112 [Podila minutissima]|uniref:RhoGAP-domain-containing protein n=1 Tax=Podila minutissima TaxID=64525 RepID=A0A9P5SMY4_9FUNG|nr:hypothetical protein BG006_005112 [Podila minutissima]